jgi:hypothetical protein
MPPQLSASCLSFPRAHPLPTHLSPIPEFLMAVLPTPVPFPFLCTNERQIRTKRKGGPMPHPGQYMVDRFLLKSCVRFVCVPDRCEGRNRNADRVFVSHGTSSKSKSVPGLSMLQLPTCTAASSQEDRTIRCKWKFIFQKKLFPSDDVNSGDNDVLLPVLSTVRCRLPIS